MPTRRRFLLSASALTAAIAAPLAAPAEEKSAALPPAIAALKNRSHEAAPISPAERQARADKARALMAEKKIGALCITGGSSWATSPASGRDSRSGSSPGFCPPAARRTSSARRSRRAA